MGYGIELVPKVAVMWSKELKCVVSGKKNYPKWPFLRHYDVISTKNNFHTFKWCHWAHVCISYGIVYWLSVKSGSNGIKIAQMCGFWSKWAQMTIFDVISTENLIFRIFKWCHWVPWWISYGIGYCISVKRGSNWVQRAKMCGFRPKWAKNYNFT